jgi:hypothetical protein
MKKSNAVSILLTVFISSAVIISFAYAVNSYLINKPKSVQENNQEINSNQIIGGDRDEHGCLGPAGYSWCEIKQKCLRVWEEECLSPVGEAIKQAFVKKYKKDLTEIKILVSQETTDFARGGVKFAMNNNFGEGGNFLAAKIDNQWKIIYDGNGEISCQLVESYNFPEEMISDCAK